MRKLDLGTGAFVGGLLTAPLIAVMYLADHLAGLPFVPYDLFDWITRVLPGPLVTFGIDMMIDTMRLFGISVADTAKTAEQIIAVLQFLFMGVVVGAGFLAIMRVRDARPDVTTGLVAGGLFGLPMVAISIAIGPSTSAPIANVLWLLALFLAWGAATGLIHDRLTPSTVEIEAGEEEAPPAKAIDRRQFLIRLGAATATITVVGAGVGESLARGARRELEEELEKSMAHETEGSPRSPFPNANDPVMPAPGTRPEYTPVKDHYKVFIRVEPTVIDGATYTLPITGLVGNPLMLTLDDIRDNYESQSHYVTLSCISGLLGTTLISTTQWTGVSMQKILADAKLQSNARHLFISSGDGFYESVPLAEIDADPRIMLCYAWDGNTLPVNHGFPLRIWRPDRYGMKQPKWITSMEVTEEEKLGYWVERRWDAIARVKAVSVVDTVAAGATYESDGQQMVPVGGIAFAGVRGISKVEVRVDGGGWRQTQLREPLSDTTWVIWRYDWPFEAGKHTFEVRCAEADGTPMIEEFVGNRPSGASGIHSLPARL